MPSPGRLAHLEKKSSSPSIIRRPEVERRTGLSRSGIYAAMRAGTFPGCVALSSRAVGWSSTAVDAWIAARLEKGAAERAARTPISPPQRRKAESNNSAGA
ncbi:MAG TPA: AlpA family phage regulatory protein [Rhodocyclaceae bacterium]|nr:AlpA family phage regulatory protein [Thiobacillaceae bacterium]HNE44233.1 AlpA family phage regulatory protein [Rhodocyclaceae bacterium]HNG04558.1 AlpA family phage regulatory protein [Nitrospira sp.]